MSEQKAVLLSHAQADLKTIASADETRGIRYLHATSEFVEATNGHIILRVPHDGISADEFPALKGAGVGLNGQSVLLDPKVLDRAVKNTEKKGRYPVLCYVHLSLGEAGEPLLSATDLETEVTIRQKKAEDTYPDTTQVWPHSPRYVFTLGAIELDRLVNWAIKHGEARGAGATMRFFTQGSERAIKVQIPRPDGGMAEGGIMPVRDSLATQEEEAAKTLRQAAALGAPPQA